MGGLVLSRRIGEKIIIGEGADKITIQVVDFRGGTARVHIDAPRNVAVHRKEVYDKLHRPPVPAEAATDVKPSVMTSKGAIAPKGLAGAGMTPKELGQQMEEWDGQDDQVFLEKMRDQLEREGK